MKGIRDFLIIITCLLAIFYLGYKCYYIAISLKIFSNLTIGSVSSQSSNIIAVITSIIK